MKWFTSKAKEAAEAASAFHERALKAERERDMARAVREHYRGDRDKARADNKALRDQLQAVTAERDKALANNRALLDYMANFKEIADKYQEENES